MMVKLFTPFRLKRLRRYIDPDSRLHILDVGVAGFSPTLTKRVFKNSGYTALEREQPKQYYDQDTDKDDQRKIDITWINDLNIYPDLETVNKYDICVFASVIEHLDYPMTTFRSLMESVRPGGLLYIEYPNINTFKVWTKIFPDVHFHHEDEHRFLPNTEEMINELIRLGWKVMEAGRRRDWLIILLTPVLMPARMLMRKIRGHRLFSGGDIYDLMGYADYILAKKQ